MRTAETPLRPDLGSQMEEPAILRLNLQHYARLLEIETDEEKRVIIMALIEEIRTVLACVPASG